MFAHYVAAGVDHAELVSHLLAPMDLANEVPDEAQLRKESDDFSSFMKWSQAQQRG